MQQPWVLDIFLCLNTSGLIIPLCIFSVCALQYKSETRKGGRLFPDRT